MAKNTQKPQLSKRQKRKMLIQQIVMGIIATILILAFIIPSLAS